MEGCACMCLRVVLSLVALARADRGALQLYAASQSSWQISSQNNTAKDFYASHLS